MQILRNAQKAICLSEAEFPSHLSSCAFADWLTQLWLLSGGAMPFRRRVRDFSRFTIYLIAFSLISIVLVDPTIFAGNICYENYG